MTASLPAKAELKRKHGTNATVNAPSTTAAHRARKRARTQDARQIAVQMSDKALKDGELDVDKFLRAREWEIRALEAGMKGAKWKAQDNTPTVTAKTRKPRNTRDHLRLDTAKRLGRLAAKAKARGKNGGERRAADQAASGKISARPAKTKKHATASASASVLLDAVPLVAKYRKRQMHKTWLPTHIYHTKRAHMTPPRDPLWRFALPLTPTEKSYRSTHRASHLRGAVAWDTSYMATIGLMGRQDSIEQVLKLLGVGREDEGQGGFKTRDRKWREGRRSWTGWTLDGDGDTARKMAPVTVIWCVRQKRQREEKRDGPTTSTDSGPSRRKVMIRVHPSAFLQLWHATLGAAKRQHPIVQVEDLRFEIGSIDVTGPGATEALVATLRPVSDPGREDDEVSTTEETWAALNSLTSPASLPRDVLLGFAASDPRLRHPPRTLRLSTAAETEHTLLEVLATWPPDQSQGACGLFDRNARLHACRALPSQKSIHRRQAQTPPGAYPDPLPSDPQIPVVILALRSLASGPSVGQGHGQGQWTVLLPWRCVGPVWSSLMHYPLSSGGTLRLGGLRETQQVAWEAGLPWFPGDFPGTSAGWAWELRERARRRAAWERRPKGKRVEWASVALAGGRRGESGQGWACDWERLMQPLPKAAGAEQHTGNDDPREERHGALIGPNPARRSKSAGAPPTSSLEAPQSSFPLQAEPPTPLRLPFHHPSGPVVAHLLRTTPTAPTAPTAPSTPTDPLHVRALAHGLVTIKFSMVDRGTATTCARIYRLPSSDLTLRQQWLDLLRRRRQLGRQSGRSTHRDDARDHDEQDPSVSRAMRRQALADSLLPNELAEEGTTCVGTDSSHPPVPDDEDLIGFVTTGDFSLGEGKGTGVGSVLLGRALGDDGSTSRPSVKRGSGEGRLCIVRDAGKGIGRLARWEVV
ncbi:MAG: hypothetical protein M1838_002053 [Thelocarpon superellum]|nr:MAG: hypothetical protein M1838_002053 [Thelocarpon superellum]